jgi:hypothetical protein
VKRIQSVSLTGLCALMTLATACADQEARDAAAQAQATAAAAQAQSAQIDKYLTELSPWLLFAAKAICQLEEQNPSGLDPALRICPSGGTGVKPPPTYPPPQP